MVNNNTDNKERSKLKNYINSLSNYDIPFFHIYSPTNSGAIARNIGAKKARGDYIFFLDSDVLLDIDYAKKIGNRVKSKKSDCGILVCGSGTGMAIAANKIKGVRAAVCYSEKSTILSRLHNDANIICLGSRLTKKNVIIKSTILGL